MKKKTAMNLSRKLLHICKNDLYLRLKKFTFTKEWKLGTERILHILQRKVVARQHSFISICAGHLATRMGINMQNKNYIRLSLEEMGIYTYEDYKFTIESNPYRSRRSFATTEFFYYNVNIVDQLRTLVLNYYDGYHYDQLQGQYISIDPNFCHNETMKNYMCLFPKRSLIETSALLSHVDTSGCAGSIIEDLPPSDFVKEYFRFQELIDSNISYLYPIKTDEIWSTISESIVDSSTIDPIENIAEASQKGSIERIVQNKDFFYIALPWLYNAKTSDYIEICDKYPAEFDCLANTIEKLALASKSEGYYFQEAQIKDLKDALCNIQISYEKKRSQLKSKGITTVVGFALTCMPFVVPHFFDLFDTTLFQTLIGSSSLVESVKLLNDYNDLKLEGITNPFWVVWKWKQETPRLNF